MTCVDTRGRHEPIVVPLGPDPDDDGIFIDWFAGGGGASEGARAAGWAPTYALNHNQTALWMHEVNHPDCLHIRDDAYAPLPSALVGRRRIRGMWFSPDCTHHSPARGKAKRDPRIRGLAWVIVRWAKLAQPDVIFMENVRQWLDWGPVYPEDHPREGHVIPERKGEYRALFFKRLRQAGYHVEHRVICVADIGVPTIRTRLVVIAGAQRPVDVRLEQIGAAEGTRRRQVLEFLWRHFGAPDEADWADPTGAAQARLRFGLVKVEGVWREIADIGTRMLTVRELFRIQGFPEDYVIDRNPMGGEISPTKATLMAGNSVPPRLAEQCIALNLGRRPAPPPVRLWPNAERAAA